MVELGPVLGQRSSGPSARDSAGPRPPSMRRARYPTPITKRYASPQFARRATTSSCCPPSTGLVRQATLSRSSSAAHAWRRRGKSTRRAAGWLKHACPGSSTRATSPRTPQRRSPKQVDEADPHQECMVIWAGAPPCQNFSIIASRQGHEGETGKLFLSSVNLMGEIRPMVAPRPSGQTKENVRGHAPSCDAEKVSERLDMQPIFVCASDFGWITRPRLWCVSVRWEDFATDPDTGHALQWAKHSGWHRLRIDAPRKAVGDMDLDNLSFDERLLDNSGCRGNSHRGITTARP